MLKRSISFSPYGAMTSAKIVTSVINATISTARTAPASSGESGRRRCCQGLRAGLADQIGRQASPADAAPAATGAGARLAGDVDLDRDVRRS